MNMGDSRVKVLAISSGGGHWVQLLRLRAAFDGCAVTYACVRASYQMDVPGQQFVTYTDATRWDRWRFLNMLFQLAWLVFRLRPDVVISTGAAPGYVAIRLGRLIGARTIWIDSIANAEELSLSGAKIGKHADLWLTQWPHLARQQGPIYRGSVI
jgi:UDP-N-acetylglucosamine:LPS N-acetylglucosamine transferase